MGVVRGSSSSASGSVPLSGSPLNIFSGKTAYRLLGISIIGSFNASTTISSTINLTDGNNVLFGLLGVLTGGGVTQFNGVFGFPYPYPITALTLTSGIQAGSVSVQYFTNCQWFWEEES